MRRGWALWLAVCLACLACAGCGVARAEEGESVLEIIGVGTVTAGSLNLREEPSTRAKLLGSYLFGAQVWVHAEADGWCQVTTSDAQMGYMSSDYLAVEPYVPPEPPYQAGVMQQVGTPRHKEVAEEGLALSIAYPELGNLAADNALRRWMQNTQLAARQASAAGAVSVRAAYDSYWVQGRYAGVLVVGEMRQADAASALVCAVNLDAQTGDVLTYQNMFAADKIGELLVLIQEAMAQMTKSSGWIFLPDVLRNAVLTNAGVGVAVPAASGEVYFAVLPYALLIERGMMAIEIDIPLEQAEGAVQMEPSAPPEQPVAAAARPPMVALTFDDGPSQYTWSILDALEAHGAQATFFVVGNRTRNFSQTTERIVLDGHEIATHTWSHQDLTKLSQAGMETEIRKGVNAITEVAQAPVRLLRPPYGATNSDLKEVCRRMGLTIALWSVDTEDWRTDSAERTYQIIMEQVTDGSIILCHDLKESTAQAMQAVIPDLIAQGYRLVTVSELLSYSQTGGEAGLVYTHLDAGKPRVE